MKAIVLERYGDPSVLHIADLPDPVADVDELLIRVCASGINPIDLGTRQGRVLPDESSQFPMVLGWDAAGVVEAVGETVVGFSKGDRVVIISKQPSTRRGTHAELIAVPYTQAVKLPDSLNFVVAAALPLAALTALQAIEALSLSPGQSLLINNPLGSVGGFASQIAYHLGIDVLAPASSTLEEKAKSQGVRTLLPSGQDIDRLVRAIKPEGIDGALDLVGDRIAHKTFNAVKDGGSYVTVLPEWWKPGGPYAESRSIAPTVVENNPNRADLTKLVDWLAAGVVSPRIERIFPLHLATEAHKLQEQHGLNRKLILKH